MGVSRSAGRALVFVGALVAVLVTTVVARADEAPKKTLVVSDLKPLGGVSNDDSQILTDQLRSSLSAIGRYQLVSREEMENVMKEQSFKSSDLCDSTACQAEIGGALGADKMVSGSVGKIGSSYTVTLKLIDIAKVKDDRTISRRCKCEIDEMLNMIELAAGDLMGVSEVAMTARAGPQPPPAVAPAPAPKPEPKPEPVAMAAPKPPEPEQKPATETKPEPAQPSADGSGGGVRVLPWVLIGGGVLVAGFGGFMHAKSNTTADDGKTLVRRGNLVGARQKASDADSQNRLGNIGFAAGGVIAVVGLGLLVFGGGSDAPAGGGAAASFTPVVAPLPGGATAGAVFRF